MRILIDLDGVCADFVGALLQAYNQKSGRGLTIEDITSYSLSKSVGDATINDIYHRPGFFYDLLPIPGAGLSIAALRALGHEVLICTTPASADSATEKLKWCKIHFGLDPASVIIGAKKHWIEADVLIDDSPANLHQWMAEGRIAVCYGWPYNVELKDEADFWTPGWGRDMLPGRPWSKIMKYLQKLT